MPYSLKLEPLHNSYVEIINCFNKGKPLSPDQINFMRRYHAKLSDPTFDRILKYYKVIESKPIKISKIFSRQSLSNLKKELTQNLKSHDDVVIKLSPQQFFQLKSLLINEIIYFHGNQVLTGAPYFAGGVPHVDFIQWGNLFGIIKYEELVGECALNANILIHFEEMADLKIEQCIEAYLHKQPNISPQEAMPIQPPIPQVVFSRHFF